MESDSKSDPDGEFTYKVLFEGLPSRFTEKQRRAVLETFGPAQSIVYETEHDGDKNSSVKNSESVSTKTVVKGAVVFLEQLVAMDVARALNDLEIGDATVRARVVEVPPPVKPAPPPVVAPPAVVAAPTVASATPSAASPTSDSKPNKSPSGAPEATESGAAATTNNAAEAIRKGPESAGTRTLAELRAAKQKAPVVAAPTPMPDRPAGHLTVGEMLIAKRNLAAQRVSSAGQTEQPLKRPRPENPADELGKAKRLDLVGSSSAPSRPSERPAALPLEGNIVPCICVYDDALKRDFFYNKVTQQSYWELPANGYVSEWVNCAPPASAAAPGTAKPAAPAAQPPAHPAHHIGLCWRPRAGEPPVLSCRWRGCAVGTIPKGVDCELYCEYAFSVFKQGNTVLAVDIRPVTPEEQALATEMFEFEKAQETAATAKGWSASSSRRQLQPANQSLLERGGWKAFWSQEHQAFYYHHAATKKTQWHQPYI